MSINGQYIAATGGTIREAGASVWWDRGNAVPRDRLEAAWEAAGLPAAWLPAEQSLEASAHAAVEDLRAARRFVRRAPSTDSRGGWLVVLESADAADSQAISAWRGKPAAHVYLDGVGRLQVDFPEGASQEQRDALTEQLRGAYLRHRTELDGGAVTGWMADVLYRLRAVCLRQTGGMWFIPAPALAQWHTIAEVIQRATGTVVHEMTTVFLGDSADRTVGAILAAVQREAQDAVDGMLNDIQSASAAGKPLGPRALASREKRAEELSAKLADYEALLDVKMTELAEGVKNLRATCATARVLSAAEAQ